MTDKELKRFETMRRWLDEMRDMNDEWCHLAYELEAAIIARDEEIEVLKAMIHGKRSVDSKETLQ